MASTIPARLSGLIGRSAAPTAAGNVLVQAQSPLTAVAAKLRQGDQLPLFLLAAVGLFILSPRIALRLYAIVVEMFTGAPAAADWEQWPLLPSMFPVGVTVALLTFRRNRIVRLYALVAALAVMVVLVGPLTPRAVLPLAVFALTVYAIIRLPWPRLPVALLIFGFTIASVLAAKQWWGDTLLPRIIGGFPIVLPLIWYSVYEHRREAALSLRRFILFVGGRLVGSPVVTYRDLFSTAEGAQLTATRWAGMRAIYIALIASLVAQLINRISASPITDGLTGFPLLFWSYFEYVRYCCAFVMRFNVFIGVLRLVGIPIRSNFHYWLLARTPNEHWQRWNLLAREWFLTFVFYPIMRARRWLFVAIMSAFILAGVLHVLPRILLDDIGLSAVTARTAYWVFNGLAIYLVIKLPARYPGMVETLRMHNSRVWSMVGILLTSAFYAFLHGMRASSATWGQLADYFHSLVRVFPA